MNQILNTIFLNKLSYKKKILKLQFSISICLITLLFFILILFFFNNKKKEEISTEIIENYNLYKLYNKYSNKPIIENDILGMIEIPRINIKYPVFSKYDDELLKIAPCRFYGKSASENGNLCIVGHNYNNSKFFSNLFLLKNEDEIIFYDNFENKYIYRVFSYYEVKSSDMSPVFNYDKLSKELTLITCNNINQNRLIIKAKQ